MTSTDLVMREAVEGAVAQFRDHDFEQQVALAVPLHVSPRKLLRVAATAVLDNPKLARPDLRPTLLQATLKCAADGLLPDGREAAFVIFEGKNPSVQYLAMIFGLRKIVAEYGWTIFTANVYANDTFDPDLETQRAHHKPTRLGQERGDIIGAYAAAQHKDGRRMLEIMDIAEIEKVRKVSRAKDRGPWVDWYEQMTQIRPAKRLVKKLPLDPKDRERIDRVLAATDVDTGEAVELLYGVEEPRDPSAREAPSTPEPHPAPPRGEPDQREDGLDGGSSSTGPDTIDGDATEIEFDAEPEPVRFPAGTHQGRTLDEVYADGADGIAYLRVAFQKAKTEPLRAALNDFAVTHPDVKA